MSATGPVEEDLVPESGQPAPALADASRRTMSRSRPSPQVETGRSVGRTPTATRGEPRWPTVELPTPDGVKVSERDTGPVAEPETVEQAVPVAEEPAEAEPAAEVAEPTPPAEKPADAAKPAAADPPSEPAEPAAAVASEEPAAEPDEPVEPGEAAQPAETDKPVETETSGVKAEQTAEDRCARRAGSGADRAAGHEGRPARQARADLAKPRRRPAEVSTSPATG